jgi:hypothetical protein
VTIGQKPGEKKPEAKKPDEKKPEEKKPEEKPKPPAAVGSIGGGL